MNTPLLADQRAFPATDTFGHLVQLLDQRMTRPDRSVSTCNPDEASARLFDMYSANRLRLAGCSDGFAMRFRLQALGEMEIASLSFGAAVVLEQAPMDRFILVSTQLCGRARIQAGRMAEEGGAGLIVIDPCDTPVSKHFSADSQRLHVRVSLVALERKCAELLGHELDRPLRLAPFIQHGSRAQQRWLNLLPMLLGYLDEPPLVGLAGISRALEETVLLTLLTEQPHSYRDELVSGPAPSIAPRHVQRAEAWMIEHAASDLTLGDIAAAAGVSVRSLCEGFQRSRQLSPMKFLRELRLRKVHEALRNAEPGASVTAIAEQWRFNHPGRFASEYRRRFGELPSQTLRQA